MIDRNKSPLKIVRKVTVDVLGDSRIFTVPIYRAQRVVIFVTTQLSCLIS